MNTNEGMNTQQTVIVAGASGVFGRHIVRTLREAGHTVLGLGRREGTEIRADLMDRDGLLRAVEGVRADVVVHAATALRKPPMSHKGMYGTDDLRVGGTRNLIEAAGAVGARRWIGENIVFGYGYKDFGDRVLTEADPFGGTDPDAGLARHLEGMRVKENLPVEAGLDAVSLRFGLFYGPGGATEALVGMLRKRQLPAFDDHGHVLPWINLIDAAHAVAAAIEHGRAGEAYNIVDESHLGFGGAVREVAAAYGTPKPFTVPTWLLRTMPYLHSMVGTNLTVDTAKARRELGWAPVYRTLPDGLKH
ncbi:MAG: NAD-dependent epimerase/dehydratase family protein [Streptomycetaceae bacterium]|nr:NAD-dependent epimerase/dehydratase family protein [Streptomycetaceae bacterium]